MSAILQAIQHQLADSAGRPANPTGAVAAIRAVLELHQPEQMRAGVLPSRFGAGRCTFCRFGEPLEVYRDYLNSVGRVVEMHRHGPYPDHWCETCGHDEYGHPQWPCEHVKRIAAALGVQP